MGEQTQLTTRQPTAMERIKGYILSPEVKERFSDMMGSDGIYYLNQVMILVANSEDLQKCTPASILISAMRAASLRLSVDPGQGQAWIIPYKEKATFQIGYRGIYELALRTGLYRFINMIDVYEGEIVVENRMTGIHHLEGHRTGDKVTARMLYFQLTNGFEKTFVMTVEEIAAHAEHYSQAYKYPKSKWNDPRERPKMERKTVLSNGLRKWGRFNSSDIDTLNAIEEDQGFIDRSGEKELGFPTDEQVKENAEALDAVLAQEVEQETETIPAPEQPKPEPPMNNRNSRPYDPTTLLKMLSDKIAKFPANTTCTDNERNMIAVNINLMFAGQSEVDKVRHSVLKYLTGKTSVKDLTPQQVKALKAWINSQPDSGGEWQPDPLAAKEAQSVWTAALEGAGQEKLL